MGREIEDEAEGFIAGLVERASSSLFWLLFRAREAARNLMLFSPQGESS